MPSCSGLLGGRRGGPAIASAAELIAVADSSVPRDAMRCKSVGGGVFGVVGGGAFACSIVAGVCSVVVDPDDCPCVVVGSGAPIVGGGHVVVSPVGIVEDDAE